MRSECDETYILLTYITTSGKHYNEFKTFKNGPDKDACIQRLIDEFDELAYLFLKDGQQFIISMLITLKV